MNRLIALLVGLSLFARVTCAQPAPADQDLGFGQVRPNTWALIVGIADYQNIKDLQFADRDALAFRRYLLQTMDARADSTRIVTLLNEQAISPAIYEALENLVTFAEKGDKVYIYFSGHGDSENSTIFRSGFLLTYDTPKGNYYTNSLNIELLNRFVHTLSARNGADVIFIADACRSGNVGFAAPTGAMQTAQALTGSVADEVRVLSCQPDEISLEGEQWGNGRGLFSYHLINGLYGDAEMESQADGKISLNELNIYLSTRVPRDAAPVRQFPGVYGPMHKSIGRVVPEAVVQIRDDLQAMKATLRDVNSKGYADCRQWNLDPEQLEKCEAYHRALKADRFRPGEEHSAWTAYTELVEGGVDPVMASLMQRELAVALQREAQLFIHQLTDLNIRWRPEDMKYGRWAEDMKLSAELLGASHFLHHTLLGKHYFFAAADRYFRAKKTANAASAKKLAGQALQLADQAIAEDPQVAFYYNLKGAAATMLQYPALAVETFDQAIRINPEYPYPYANKAYALMKQGDFEEALTNLDQCIALDPEYTTAYQYKITALKQLGRGDEAMKVYRQLMEIGDKKIGM